MKFSLVVLVALAIVGSANVNAGPISSSDELQDIIDDYLALLPKQKIQDLLTDYMQNDQEFQKFLGQLFSDEFRKLYDEVENLDEVKNCYKYLAESGLNIYGFVNKLHELLGLPPIPVDSTLRLQSSRGINGFLKDLKALVPLDRIKALYEQKIASSPAYRNLIDRLAAPYFQETFDKLRKIPKYCQVMGFLEESGLDIDDFKDLLLSLFNFHLPNISCTQSFVGIDEFLELARSVSDKEELSKDLQEFKNLLPVKKIRNIAMKHYVFDSEFRKAINYIRSEQFYKLIREVNGIPQYQELLKALENIGVDVPALVKAIDKALGYKSVSSPNMSVYPRCVASFITEVKAVLPVSEITALYKKKLETSKSFKALVDLIKSQLFQDITNALFADDIFKDFLHKAKDHGVNLGKIADFFLSVFGIKTPPGIID